MQAVEYMSSLKQLKGFAILLQSPERYADLLIALGHPGKEPGRVPASSSPHSRAESRAPAFGNTSLVLWSSRSHINGKTFPTCCFLTPWKKQLYNGVTWAVTSCCSPQPRILSIYDSMAGADSTLGLLCPWKPWQVPASLSR